jgi:hypothetical protein
MRSWMMAAAAAAVITSGVNGGACARGRARGGALVTNDSSLLTLRSGCGRWTVVGLGCTCRGGLQP